MKRSKPTFIDKLVRLGAIGLATALALGILAGNIDPRSFQLIAFFGLAYPYVLLLNIIMIAWWCIRRRWLFAATTLVLILLGWHSLTTTFGFIGEKGLGPKADPGLIRMMTYNVHSFKPYGEGNIESVKQQMLDLIENENPDIICFQEYFTRKKGPYDITDSLKRILNKPYHYFEPISQNDYEATGLAIFSKYPIKNKGTIAFNKVYRGNSSIYVDVTVKNKMFRIYNVHMQSISFQEQDYMYLDQVKYQMDPKLYASKRILVMLRNAFLKRSEQVDIMKAHIKTCELPFIIAGDFNDTPASYAVKQMTKSLKNTFKEQGTGFGKTYNGKFPNFQIDYIATTQNFDVMNYRIIEAKLSDHFPVRSDLRLNP
ncbi:MULTISPECIES: endonuclease/exonuclease/phosphatase family protein [Pedobacter]|uniref:Endonuclease/exonuclease/phosphatase n=1 Tax=Pedobacter heparinus (strain ATCC 13125 / DSM 2366 / CIP 104194 / JCM 7457 / NBRC 12017 / NCIMB 9290 / NRRL B-14731 / HIM 762-3) TaxID=485917 RepID=C6Y013_PEDHD|nr:MULTISPECIES: endonuclease/exonuclease/phosphatase family protein [Pedobacter]ACU02708.1 Endonuclease/exonuclease/phosphatase [Pedobacter heparinus DSM 2366]MBB5438033.1 endonuclease/exonuclease/phosphatase family metal-dependent hydrolase [Pedobacter sp. AK017]